MARAWRRAVLVAFAAAMLSACAIDASAQRDPPAGQRAVDAKAASSGNWFSHLFGRSSGDSALAPICNFFSRLFGGSSGGSAPALSAPPPPKVSAPVEPPPAPKAAAATPEPPATGRYLVQLAAARTEQEAGSLAAKAKRTFPAELGARGQSIDEAVLGNMGTFYLVRFGPFASVEETRTVCAKLRDSGIDCLPVSR